MSSFISKAFGIGVMTCIFILISTARSLAGAWVMGSGELYERLAFNYYYAGTEYGANQDHLKSFRDTDISNYIEYGITDRITLINSIYYKFLKKEDQYEDVSSNGLGDIDLGVKYKVADGSWGVLSTQGLIKIPGLYGKDDPLPLGNAQYDFELRVLYGRSLWPVIPGYCNFEIGYRWRFGDPSDEIRYLIEFGADITKNIYGRIKLDSILSMDNGTKSNNPANPMAYYNYDLGKLDIALGIKITKAFGIELCYTPAIYGWNTTQGATYTVALVYLLK